VHAGFLFASEFPELTEQWHLNSQFVVCLQTSGLDALNERFNCLHGTGAPHVMFYEADLDGEPTAFATLGTEAGRVLANLPLTLKEPAMV
jgi:hypothetical protein